MNSELHFENSKSGELTCCFQGKYFHSKYNPTSEGEKFAANIQADFSPLCVFIIEPALSYCAPFLRKRFPNAVLAALRFSDDFSESDSKWDFVFHLKKSGKINEMLPLSEALFSALGEEKLISSLAFDWNPTKLAFPSENLAVWNEIKKAVLKARDVLGTRSYFSKRWLKNALIFAANVQHPFLLKNLNKPVIIAASGPSLESSLPFLKKFRASYFLIAVSSAFLPLSRNGIESDLVMSSDGGYWAKKHLDFPKNQAKTVFALEAESAVPKKLLAHSAILPLVYADGLERDLLAAIHCPALFSERNGTVAGTALSFACSLTNGNIYLCGLDQAPAPAFQHTQPNALETDNAKKDFRLRTTETRLTSSRFLSAPSLEIYRNWFISNSERFSSRVFRLSDNFAYTFSLGNISEKNWADFQKNEINRTSQSEADNSRFFTEEKIGVAQKERVHLLTQTLKQLSKTERFTNEVFPMESILIRRELSPLKKEELSQKLHEKISIFLSECEKLL